MQMQVKGKPLNIASPIVGRIARDGTKIDADSILVAEEDLSPDIAKSSLAVISSNVSPHYEKDVRQIYAIETLEHLEDGDLVSLDGSGTVRTLYRASSFHNSILVTEMCNNKCLMCSQPPKRRNDVSSLFDIHNQLIPLIPEDCAELTITGGEPTLLEHKLFDMLSVMHEHLPKTNIHILTNGRKFAWFNFAQRLADIDTGRISFGIPVYSDFYALHDYVVQAESAFYQTIRGLHNLARLNQRIEIRLVLHKLTMKRLVKLAHYIYKNLPFAEHVAFMGLENTGFTPYNADLLWIDPYDYMEQLKDAVLYLDSFGMNVSIYNHQLCTLPSELWCFARKSISEWKNVYLDECGTCRVRSECGGFFESSRGKHSRHVKPILSDTKISSQNSWPQGECL